MADDKDLATEGMKDRLKGAAKQAEGRVRGTVGGATGDTSEQLKGKAQEIKGKGPAGNRQGKAARRSGARRRRRVTRRRRDLAFVVWYQSRLAQLHTDPWEVVGRVAGASRRFRRSISTGGRRTAMPHAGRDAGSHRGDTERR